MNEKERLEYYRAYDRYMYTAFDSNYIPDDEIASSIHEVFRDLKEPLNKLQENHNE